MARSWNSWDEITRLKMKIADAESMIRAVETLLQTAGPDYRRWHLKHLDEYRERLEAAHRGLDEILRRKK